MIRLVLNSPPDNEDKGGENKTGENISLYIVIQVGLNPVNLLSY